MNEWNKKIYYHIHKLAKGVVKFVFFYQFQTIFDLGSVLLISKRTTNNTLADFK